MDKLAVLRWSAHLCLFDLVPRVWRRAGVEARFKQPVPVRFQAEHRTAQLNRVNQRRARHIFNNPRRAGCFQCPSRRWYQSRVVVSPYSQCLAVRLARRTGVYRVKLMAVACDKIHRISLVELERISRLRVNIHTNHLKSS